MRNSVYRETNSVWGNSFYIGTDSVGGRNSLYIGTDSVGGRNSLYRGTDSLVKKLTLQGD